MIDLSCQLAREPDCTDLGFVPPALQAGPCPTYDEVVEHSGIATGEIGGARSCTDDAGRAYVSFAKGIPGEETSDELLYHEGTLVAVTRSVGVDLLATDICCGDGRANHLLWGPALPEGLACLEDLPPESFRD